MMKQKKRSSLPGPFLLLLFLSSPVSGLGTVLTKNFMYMQDYRTWQEAQAFCRRSNYYFDLAFLSDQLDVDGLDLQSYSAWIGLSKSLLDKWKWVDGSAMNYVHWAPSYQPQSLLAVGDVCAYANFIDKMFYGTVCGQTFFFICYKLVNNNYEYIFINQSKTWSDAQQYCTKLYNDLAIINSDPLLNSSVIPQDFPVWTGLYRDGGTWKWSTGLSDYRNWAPNQPGDNGDCVAIYSLSKTMITESCSVQFPFVCYRDNLVLVKEEMTWEEAMEYCKNFAPQNNGPLQLASVQPGDEYNYMMSKVLEANTDEVWTGLRFLAGYWFWINGADMSFSDLPTCPVPEQHCGAFSKENTGTLEARDCSDKKNFLCYSQW
ncbi:hypothetical protein Q5P01_006925 [Channa striata]|uniref:C-type lectin domain-containing protein n=1 Tax=Channa striata TaxID=64152 RepID=A0AA88NC79_CHASR|nr:hypothetical protein Q5P01_006925 [Channa striata]